MYLAEKMVGGASLEDAMNQSLDDLDGVFTYVAVTGDSLGVAKDEMVRVLRDEGGALQRLLERLDASVRLDSHVRALSEARCARRCGAH